MLLKPKNSVISNPRRYHCCTQVSISTKITDLSRQSMVELYRTCRDRTYRESDPTLHRLIRNFKDSAQSTPGILMTERGGENCISFAEELPSREFLLAPPEYLGAYVTTLIAQCFNTKEESPRTWENNEHRFILEYLVSHSLEHCVRIKPLHQGKSRISAT